MFFTVVINGGKGKILLKEFGVIPKFQIKFDFERVGIHSLCLLFLKQTKTDDEKQSGKFISKRTFKKDKNTV